MSDEEIFCVSSRSKSPTECRYPRDLRMVRIRNSLLRASFKVHSSKAGNDDIPAVGRINRIESHRTEYIPGRHLTAVIISGISRRSVVVQRVQNMADIPSASSTADLQNYRDKLRDGWAHYHVHTVPQIPKRYDSSAHSYR